MNILYILGVPLGYVMQFIHSFVPNYGLDIILFTVLVRVIAFPLQMQQQKMTASMSAFQPMLMEIQKKYANDQERYQQEVAKLQELGYNPTSGCLPMILNFLVMFGVIEVVEHPLQRILHISADSLTAVEAALKELSISFTVVNRDTHVLSQFVNGTASVIESFTSSEQVLIEQFSHHMTFFGIDLSQMPQLSLSAEALPLLIFPILSVLTMLLSTELSMRASGQQITGQLRIMNWSVSLIFVFFCFQVPVAFSLYYTISNIMMFCSSMLLRKIYNPEKMKKKVLAEIEAKKKASKTGTKSNTVTVKNKEGELVEKNISASEMAKLRLEYARKLDEEAYADERTAPIDPDYIAAAQAAQAPEKEEK